MSTKSCMGLGAIGLSLAGTCSGDAVEKPRATAADLTEPVLASDTSLEEALHRRRSVREFAPDPLTLAELSQLLWAAQGVTSAAGGRTAPSAGALYPLEVYAAVGRVEGLAPGIYHYDPEGHRLEAVGEGDLRTELASAALDQDWVAESAAVLVLAAVYERTARKYGARAERYVHVEVGAAGQNVYLQAAALGLGTTMVGAFDDDRVQRVLGLSADERPLALMPLGRPRR